MQHDEISKLLAQFFAELSEKLNLLIAKCEGKPEQEAQITEVVGNCEEQLRTEVKHIMQDNLLSGRMSRAELKQLITDMGQPSLSVLNRDELIKLKTKLGEQLK